MDEPPVPRQKQQLGLMTSLPIYWSGGELADMLTDEGEPHWVRSFLEKQYELVLLDSFAAADGLVPNAQLAGLTQLVLAQPAALPPADLVALDDWVRSGGRLLLFADPMLTEETDFGLGDKRRPQDMATLSPLLKRWGLEEGFDPAQLDLPSAVTVQDQDMPVHIYGQFASADASACTLLGERLVADCVIGDGRAVIILDAHMLAAEPIDTQKNRALRRLMDIAFSQE